MKEQKTVSRARTVLPEMETEREETHRPEIMAEMPMGETVIPVTDVRLREMDRMVTDARAATETLTEMVKDSVAREIIRMAREKLRVVSPRDVRMVTDVRVDRVREALAKMETEITTDVRPSTEEMMFASR